MGAYTFIKVNKHKKLLGMHIRLISIYRGRTWDCSNSQERNLVHLFSRVRFSSIRLMSLLWSLWVHP